MKTGISIAPIALILLLFLACDKEEVKLCDAEEYLGKFELLPGSDQMVPYADTMRLVFQNADLEEITLVALTRNTKVGWTVTGPCPYVESLWIKKKYDFVGKETELFNDSLPFRLNIDLVPISSKNRLTPNESDHLQFELFDYNEYGRYYSGFSLLVKGENVIQVFYGSFLGAWEPLGRSFQNVYTGQIETNDGTFDLFYNAEIGLVGFTYIDGKLWMFDRVE